VLPHRPAEEWRDHRIPGQGGRLGSGGDLAEVALHEPQGGAGVDVDPASAIAQYIEAVPTAEGERPTRAAGAGSAVAVSPAIEAEISRRGGDDAEALERLASDPALGATPKESQPLRVPSPSGLFGAGLGSGAGLISTAGIVAGLLMIAVVAAWLRLERPKGSADRTVARRRRDR